MFHIDAPTDNIMLLVVPTHAQSNSSKRCCLFFHKLEMVNLGKDPPGWRWEQRFLVLWMPVLGATFRSSILFSHVKPINWNGVLFFRASKHSPLATGGSSSTCLNVRKVDSLHSCLFQHGTSSVQKSKPFLTPWKLPQSHKAVLSICKNPGDRLQTGDR